MRILYISGNPDDEVDLRVDAEVGALQREIDDAPTSEPIELKVRSGIRVDELPSVISRAEPDIIHFAAHGLQDAIVLADRYGAAVPLRGDALARLLLAIGVRPALVVLNACSSLEMAHGVARAADFVIGTDAPIGNDAARVMAATLYQRLARGSSVLHSFEAAEAMLAVVSGEQVSCVLLPEERREEARRRVLFEPLRIVARLDAVDRAIRAGSDEVAADFDPDYPLIRFGVAGAPDAATQLVLFTDDEEMQPQGGMSMEEARSWVMPTRSVRGEMWTKPPYHYVGDMDWYAAVVTGDRRIVSVHARTSKALERYYLEEEWEGVLSPGLRAVVGRVLATLAEGDGARRRRGARGLQNGAPAPAAG